jgi:hypothetical protein
LQVGADVISSDAPLLSVDDLADQVAEVLDFFGYACCSLLQVYLFILIFYVGGRASIGLKSEHWGFNFHYIGT